MTDKPHVPEKPSDVRTQRLELIAGLDDLMRRVTELRKSVERGEPLAILDAMAFARVLQSHGGAITAAVAAGDKRRKTW
jgi:hypothetical protein